MDETKQKEVKSRISRGKYLRRDQPPAKPHKIQSSEISDIKNDRRHYYNQ